MKVNVYVPDDLGQQAKEAELPFSQLLQEAIRSELHRRSAVDATLNEIQTYEIQLEDNDGRAYRGRITGKQITESGNIQVFLTEDGRLIVYDERASKHHEYGDGDDPAEALRGWLNDESYFEAMDALGQEPVVDL